MPAVLPLTALGVPVDLRFHGPRADEAHAAFADRWRLCARPFGSAERSVQVTLGEEIPGSPEDGTIGSTDLRRLLMMATQRVTYQAIHGNIGSLLMFHAAAVCNPVTGAAVVSIAPGGTGKTTVCRTLGPGRGYLSDETVGVREDGTIVPYPKPLSVRRDGWESKDETDPTSIGLVPTGVTPYVAAVLLLDRDDAHRGPARLEPLDLFDAIIAIAPETSSLSRLPRPLHRLQDLLEGLPVVARAHYAEAATLEPAVTELIGAPAGHGTVRAR
jgi:hypothetical protein